MDFIKTHKFAFLFALLGVILYGSFSYDLVRHDFIKLFSLVLALFYVAYQLIKIYGWNFWLLAGVGFVFRLVFLPSIPNLSQDFYRFIWDGRLIFQGINPYIVTPESYLEVGNEVVHQANELYGGMGALNGSHYSNYPPVNQLFFSIAALFSGKSIVGSAVVLRLLIIAADVGILFFGKKLLEGLKLPVKNIFWYFLNPFIIIELSGNLHFEGVMLFFVVWALYLLFKGRWVWAAVLLGVSVSVKLLPLLLLPLFFQYFVKKEGVINGFWKLTRFYLITLLTVVISFSPFLSSEFISNFSSTIALWFQNFEFNASIYYIIRWIGFQTIGWNIIADVGKILPMVIVLLLVVLAFLRRNGTLQQLISCLLFGVSIYFLLSTTVHPWYVATPLLLSIFTTYRYAILWSLLVMLSYTAYSSNGFSENLWFVALEYVGVIGFFTWELFFKKKSLTKAS